MTPPYDPITLIGGGGLFGGLVYAFTLLVKRLTAQDTGWKAIIEQQAEDIRNLRAERVVDRAEITRLGGELARAQLQISELQRWGVQRDP